MPGLLYFGPRLGEYFAEGWPFSVAWPTQPPLAPQQLALLTADGSALQAVALMTRSTRMAATHTWHLKFDPVLAFYEEVPLAELVGGLRPPMQGVIARALERGGAQLSDEAMDEIIGALTSARPDTAEQIDSILRLLDGLPPLNDELGSGEPVVLYEADAVATALEFADLEKSQLRSWSGTSHAPFLEGIEEFRVSEEQLLSNDSHHFGDWEIVQENLVGGVVFSSPRGRRLTVFNVNREPIERTLGVDLIYYNHDFDAYVLVQYKRMTKTHDDSVFRPDDQLSVELERMRRIAIDDSVASQIVDYRLDHHCCFIKLCWPATRRFYAGDISPGMYFPLAYWDLLLASPVTEGERGGRRILGDTVGRRLTKTDFVPLVQDAWVGSRGLTSDEIEDVIRQGLNAHHSVIVASGTTGRGVGE